MASPLMIFSFWNIRAMLDGTARGFNFSYGLASILYYSMFTGRRLEGQLLIAAFLIIFGAAMVTVVRHRGFRLMLRHALGPLENTDLIVLLVSASIFLLTFFLFTSWAYRLIFVAPVFFVLSLTLSPVLSKLAC